MRQLAPAEKDHSKAILHLLRNTMSEDLNLVYAPLCSVSRIVFGCEHPMSSARFGSVPYCVRFDHDTTTGRETLACIDKL